STELFKKWGIGRKKDDRGVLILLSNTDHKYRVEVGYGLEPILPDGKVGGFGREMVPMLKKSDYSGALTLLTSRIARTISDNAHVTLSTLATQPVPPQPAPPASANPMIFNPRAYAIT